MDVGYGNHVWNIDPPVEGLFKKEITAFQIRGDLTRRAMLLRVLILRRGWQAKYPQVNR
jgi:hypothetical protein